MDYAIYILPVVIGISCSPDRVLSEAADFMPRSGDTVASRGRTFTQGKLGEFNGSLPEDWVTLNDTRWETYDLMSAFNKTGNRHVYRRPSMFHSESFGYVVAERVSLQQMEFPEGRYWSNVRDFERTCLCQRKLGQISPNLTFAVLDQETVFVRPIGHGVRIRWFWNETWEASRQKWKAGAGVDEWSHVNDTLMAMTKFKLIMLRTFAGFSAVRSTCRTKRMTKDTWNWTQVDQWNKYNASSSSIAHCWPDNVLWVKTYSTTYDWETRETIKRLVSSSSGSRGTCVFCDITGIISAFEPSQADIIIQEIDTIRAESAWERKWHPMQNCRATSGLITQGNYEHLWQDVQHSPTLSGRGLRNIAHPPSCNFWPTYNESKWGDLPTTNFPRRIRWIQVSLPNWKGRDDQGLDWDNLFDGSVERPSAPYDILPIWRKHSSLVAGDPRCQERIKDSRCRDPVGGPQLKAAFWDQVHFDPEHDRPRFPGGPIEIKGDLARNNKRVGRKRRRKRFLFGLLALIFAVVSVVAVVATVSSQLHKETEDLSNQINDRMIQATERSSELGKKINELSQIQTAQQQKLDRLVENMEVRASLTDRRLAWMQKMMEKNRQMILRQATITLAQFQSFTEVSDAELAIDRLVMKELANLTGKSIFDSSKVYLTQIRKGTLRVREHAQQLDVYKDTYLNETNDISSKLRANRLRLKQAQQEVDLSIQVWKEDLNRTVFVNISDWRYENVSVAPFEFAGGEEFMKNFGKTIKEMANGAGSLIESVGNGAGNLLQKGLGAIGGLFGSGLSGIFSGLGSILLPLGLVLGAVIILFCCVRYHSLCCPKLKSNVQRRNTSAQLTMYITSAPSYSKKRRPIVRW